MGGPSSPVYVEERPGLLLIATRAEKSRAVLHEAHGICHVSLRSLALSSSKFFESLCAGGLAIWSLKKRLQGLSLGRVDQLTRLYSLRA